LRRFGEAEVGDLGYKEGLDAGAAKKGFAVIVPT
jgi:hypothetical protein